jgi:hypothetical protein
MKNTVRYGIVALVAIVLFAVPKWRQAQRVNKLRDHLEKEYAPLGTTADEILSHDDPNAAYKVLGALQYRIDQKADVRGERSLTDTERKLLAAWGVEGEVNNGGFDQYFSNPAGDNAEAALAGLREMGALKAAALLERAMAVFPDGKPPADRFRRQRVMDQIASRPQPVWEKCDSEFYDLTESISDLSLAYARQKRAEIILP